MAFAFLLARTQRALSHIYLRFGLQTRHEPGIEVRSRVEATEEDLQALV
jgi:hypothetical protein